MKEEQTSKPVNRGFLNLFIIMVPSLLLAMTSSIDSLPIRLGFQIVLLVLQLVLAKSLIETFVGER